MPKVLISDKLSKAAVDIFESAGVEVDFQPDLGKDPAALLKAVADIDGLAVRSATKVTAEVLAAAPDLRVIGRAGVGVDNIDIPAAYRQGHCRHEHALRQLHHHGRTRNFFDASPCARQIPAADASTQAPENGKSRSFMGVRE